MRRLLVPAFVLATFGCHSGATVPDGGSDGAGRGDAAVGDAPGGRDDVAEQMADAGAGDVATTCVSYGQPCSETQHCCGGLICAGSCSMGVSDRNLKHDFAPVDDDEILRSLAALPISSWRYKTDETSARHIGPTAQDFQSAFHVGSTDKLIYQVDGDGVAFAAIKSLNARLNRLADENAALHRELSRVHVQLHDVRAKPR